MGRRLELHNTLCSILEQTSDPKTARRRVYFQPPASKMIEYPCIVYTKTGMDVRYAGNLLYSHKTQYTVTVIDEDPDTVIPDGILRLPFSSYDRRFTNDNLYHDVFKIYF